jgi:DNA-binding winged helix-turn-helix (wHTH) protein
MAGVLIPATGSWEGIMPVEETNRPTFAADFRMGEWLVEPSLDRLSRDGTAVHLRPQLTDLLVLLARHAGRTVSKDVILSTVWNGQFVAESGMTRCIAEIRQALGDDARNPKIVQTITKRGYRLVAPVSPAAPSELTRIAPVGADVPPNGIADIRPSPPVPMASTAAPLPHQVGRFLGTVGRFVLSFLGGAALLVVACGAAGRSGAPTPPMPQSRDLADVLRRAGEAVVRHAEQSAVLLADEACQQSAFRMTRQLTMFGAIGPERWARRRWKAELAFVRLPDRRQPAVPWIEVRDVVEVDGVPLPGRDALLQRVLRVDPQWKTKTARDMVDESARFNIGPVRRTTNVPTLPLLVLHPDNQSRFVFNTIGEKTTGGMVAWKVGFSEQARPALIRAADDGSDMPSAGSFQINPDSGEVIRADLWCGRQAETRLSVTYVRHQRFELHLPAEMTEYAAGADGEWVEGKCSYSNFRRFETSGRMIVPKLPNLQ